MRVLLVSCNRERLPDPVLPIGLFLLAANLPSRHPRNIEDVLFRTDPAASVRDAVRTFRPDLVALGLRNGVSSDHAAPGDVHAGYREIAAAVRESTSAPMVIGGSAFSVFPRELMEVMDADFGLEGEAEDTFPLLVDALEAGLSTPEIPGLWFRHGDTFVGIPRGESGRGQSVAGVDLNRIAFPDLSQVDPQYFAEGACLPVQTRRGCAFQCAHCTYPSIEGRLVRCMRPERAVDAMFNAMEHAPAARHLFVVDSVFTYPRNHALAVAREMARRHFPLPWTAYANPVGFDTELAQAMAEARCVGL